MMRDPEQERFPLAGYIIINAVVIALCLAAWIATKKGLLMLPPAAAAGRPGVASMLIFVPMCFLLATLFDLVWRVVGRHRDRQAEPEEPVRGGSSTAIKRDSVSRETEKV
jgi:hypothetical protein